MSSTQEVGNLFAGPAHAMLRSPTVLIASVGLWGMNVYFYRLFGIDYIKVLKYDLIKLEQQEQQQQEYATTTTTASHTNGSSSPQKRKNSSSSIEMTMAHNNADNNNNNNDMMMMTMLKADYDDNNSDIMLTDDDSITSSLVSSDEKDKDSSTTVTLLPKTNVVTATTAAAAVHASSSSSAAIAAAAAAAITWQRLVGLSLTLLFMLHFSYFWWIDTLGGGLLGAVYVFYGIVLTLVVLPLHCTMWLRRAVQIVLFRSFELINPRCHCLKSSGSSSSSSSSKSSSSSSTHGGSGTNTSTAAATATATALYIPRPIPFVDVFFADAMCSLSKVFFDWGMLLLMAYYNVVKGSKTVPRSLHSILIPSCCAAVPYIIRARQCLIMYTVGRLTQDASRTSHLWNALKYTTSIFPLCLSAFQKTASRQLEKDLEVYLVFLLVLNSAFALYWDVVMDWGMYQSNPLKSAFCGGPHQHHQQHSNTKQSYFTHHPHHIKTSCSHTLMRPRLRFGTAMSALILITDVILRFSWMLRFANKMLFPSQDSFVLCTQFLEVFRRAMWNLLRVEWENLKQLNMASNIINNNSTLLLDIKKKKSSPLPNNNTNTNSNGNGLTGSINSGGIIIAGSGGMMAGSGIISHGGSSPARDRGGEQHHQQQQQRKNAAAAAAVVDVLAEEMTSFLPKNNIENNNAKMPPSSSSWLRSWQKK